MHHRFIPWLLTCLLFTSAIARAQTPAASTSKVKGGGELILVAKVTGTVNMTFNGTTAPLAVDMKVSQSAKINTTKDSSVVLVFSNGATTQLGADTEMIIEEFLQDPFANEVKVADLKEEPSISTTKLKLNHGELVGKVAHLKREQGSTFTVETPVGAAGIRGTTFRIVFTPNGTGQAFFQLSTVEGTVAFTPPGGGTTTSGGTTTGGTTTGGTTTGGTTTTSPTVTAEGTATGMAVPQGQQITIDVSVTTNAAGQQVVTVLTPVSATVNIPVAVAAQVNQTAADIAVATQQAVFTPAPATTTTGGTGTGSGGTTTGGTTGGTTTGGTTTTTTGGTTVTTGATTTNSDSSKSTTVNGSNKDLGTSFTGTVTQKPPSLTPGDGKSG